MKEISMSNRMDYQLVEKKSIDKFKTIRKDYNNFTEDEQARFGFYYLVLELITGIQDIEEITKMIIDTDYLSKLYKENNKDLGIDAVFIDDEENIIYLFNFKYRSKFKQLSTAGANELLLSEKFLSNIAVNPEIDNAEKTVSFLKEINDRLDDASSIWEIRLYMVSNDGESLNINTPDLQSLRKNYSTIQLTILSLNELSDFLSIRPSQNSATLVLENNDILTYEESKMTTSKSFIIKLSLVELIKITSKDTELRKIPQLQNIDQYKDLTLDRNVLFDNVRGYLGDTTYNTNIVRTLQKEPEKFFLYNNGITIVADQIESSIQNLDKQLKIVLSNYQIVNGGQTLRSIYKFKEENRDNLENLVHANVLVRIFKTGNERSLINKIAEYTNSQNAISPIDLKSVDGIQLDLERNLYEHGIHYIRKNGIDPIDDEFEYRISMTKIGQLLLSYYGHPEKASNQKKKIFSVYYDRLFNYDHDILQKVVVLAKKYSEIDKKYELTNFQRYEQKIFYIVFLDRYMNDIDKCILLLEETLKEFREDENVPESRKLIQTKFKELLDSKLIRRLSNKGEIEIISLVKN